jgi:hypothetical protein
MGLALIGTMTGPLLVVLHTMPLALFAGVFFVVGVSIRLPCWMYGVSSFVSDDQISGDLSKPTES